MSDPSDPPRKHYQLKPKEFETVNAPTAQAAPASQPTDVQGHFHAANAAPSARSARRPADSNEVHAMLRDNVARANAGGLNELSLRPPRRSRRKRTTGPLQFARRCSSAAWPF